MVAGQPHKLEVVGSSPAPATNIMNYFIARMYSQVVWQSAFNRYIVGSIPSTSICILGDILKWQEGSLENF